MDPPPEGVDPAVWRVLCAARVVGATVTAVLRTDPARGGGGGGGAQPRKVSGVPRSFALTTDGRVRVELEVAEGSTQMVLVERIARARLATMG